MDGTFIPVVRRGVSKEEGREDVLKFGKKIVKAFEDVGFLYILDHGIPQDVVDETLDASRRFFRLPENVKAEYSKVSIKDGHGFVAVNREKLSPGQLSELRESFDFNHFSQDFAVKECPSFTEASRKLAEHCLPFTEFLLASLEKGMGLEEGFFTRCHTQMLKGDNATLFRCLHYPKVPRSTPKDTVRCGEHSDYGTLTLLFQDTIGGLEVLSKDGGWIRADPVEGAVLVNVGDLLEIWSGGRFPATKHRVLIPEEEIRCQVPRFSIAFFVHPDDDVTVQPPDGHQNYLPVRAGDHLTQRYFSTYLY